MYTQLQRPTCLMLTVALLAGLALAGGCASRDRTTLQSRVDSPKTVYLRDVYTGDELWRYEIPVGYDLSINLKREGQDESGISQMELLPATEIRWRLQRSGQWGRSVTDEGRHPLPGTPVSLGYDVRETPEFPPDYVPPETMDATPHWYLGSGGMQPAQHDRGAPRDQR